MHRTMAIVRYATNAQPSLFVAPQNSQGSEHRDAGSRRVFGRLFFQGGLYGEQGWRLFGVVMEIDREFENTRTEA